MPRLNENASADAIAKEIKRLQAIQKKQQAKKAKPKAKDIERSDLFDPFNVSFEEPVKPKPIKPQPKVKVRRVNPQAKDAFYDYESDMSQALNANLPSLPPLDESKTYVELLGDIGWVYTNETRQGQKITFKSIIPNPTFNVTNTFLLGKELRKYLDELTASSDDYFGGDAFLVFLEKDYNLDWRTANSIIYNNEILPRTYLPQFPFEIDRLPIVDVNIYTQSGKKQRSMTLRDSKAPQMANICENSPWNTSEDQCVIDYLSAKLHKTREHIQEELQNLNINYDNGITIDQLEQYLQGKANYYFVDPLLRLTHKNHNKNLKNYIYILYNNSHLYPIEEPSMQQECHHKKLNDKIMHQPIGQIEYNEDLNQLIEEKFSKDKQLPTFVEFQKDRIYRVTYQDITYVSAENIEENKEFADEFNIEYRGQSASKLAFDLVNRFKRLPEPCGFTKLNYEKFFAQQISPITRYFDSDPTNCTSLDMNRFYTSLLYNCKFEWPLLDVYAEFKTDIPEHPFQPGFYRLNHDIDQKLFLLKDTLIPNCLANFLIEKQLAKQSSFSEYVLATRVLPAEYFKEAIEHFYEFDSPYLKRLFNFFIGQCGTHQTNNSEGFITNDFSTVELYAQQGYEFKTICNTPSSILYKVYKHIRQPKYYNYRPIFTQVLSLSWMTLYDIIQELNAEIVAIKTDCIIVRDLQNLPPKKPSHTTLDQIGKLCVEELKFVYRETHFKRNDYVISQRIFLDTYWHEVLPSESILIKGRAGTGKTHLIKNEIIPYLQENKLTYLITSMSHMALSNYSSNKLVMRALQMKVLQGNLTAPDVLIVDEYSMINKAALKTLHKIKLMGSKLILVGDPYQCLPIDDEPLDYETNQVIGELVDWNRQILTVQHRADRRLTELHDQLLEHGKLTDLHHTSLIDPTSIHLCYHNKLAQKINNQLAGQTVTLNGLALIPMISISNEGLLYNNQRFYQIANRHPKEFLDLDLQPLTVSKKDFYIYCYAMTVHRSQGQTLNKVVVHELSSMTKDIAYVALSRTKSWNDLYVYADDRQMKALLNKTFLAPSFTHHCYIVNGPQKGIIYKLHDKKGRVVYVGLVEQEYRLEQRIYEHQQNDEPFSTYTYKVYTYHAIHELQQIEKQEIHAECEAGSKLYNKQHVIQPTRPPKAGELSAYLRYIIMDEEEYTTLYDRQEKKRIKRMKIGKKTREECHAALEEYLSELLDSV